ncbi:GFA family protein [Sphingosinicella sp. BN140058]|uniref:GFA family protein n=1 Tax=Sphingosinicella sp. BN140058 TaxID=1892855 RepID=UPI0010120248|nr:GFA family protein [Sphingosinicella sp. BN140058]QAY75424.1 GFA family protein [Sphingosinicella sp. BN140058]
MSDQPGLLRGECFCRGIAYEVPDIFEYALNCHCSGCRRATGAAFKPFAGIAAGHLRVVHGQDRVMRYGDELAHDAHCGRCGSLLYSLVRDGTYVHVTLGTLIDPPAMVPTGHIFVGSKAPWHRICDGLPEYAEFPSP